MKCRAPSFSILHSSRRGWQFGRKPFCLPSRIPYGMQHQRAPIISTELPFLTEWRRDHCPYNRPSPQTAERRCPVNPSANDRSPERTQARFHNCSRPFRAWPSSHQHTQGVALCYCLKGVALPPFAGTGGCLGNGRAAIHLSPGPSPQERGARVSGTRGLPYANSYPE
jgi:hypothetical protein